MLKLFQLICCHVKHTQAVFLFFFVFFLMKTSGVSVIKKKKVNNNVKTCRANWAYKTLKGQ